MSSKKSCLNCQKFQVCLNKKKGAQFLCEEYKKEKVYQETNLIDIEALFSNSYRKKDQETGELLTKQEFALAKELNTLLDPLTNQPRDLKVDDRDLAEFTNYHDFVSDKKLGLGLTPYARQLWMSSTLFQEICPFCSNPKWRTLSGVPVDANLDDCRENLVFTKFGVCSKCKKPRTSFEKYFPYRSEFMGLLGQRVGKSTMLVAPTCLYLTHKYLKMPKPYAMFGLNPTPLVGTFVAQTYKKSVEQLWLPYKSYMDDCGWFTEYHDLIKDVQNRTGEEIFKVSQSVAYYPHKNILTYPSGPNKGTLRGNTRFFAAIDETEFVDTASGNEDAVKLNAEEIHKSLDRSLATIRAAHEDLYSQGYHSILNGFGFYVSSPNTARSFLFRSIKNIEEDGQTAAYHLPTWEVHPKLRRESKVIQKAFLEDPIKANRDFGAQPVLGVSNFIEDTAALTTMCSDFRINPASYVYTKKKTTKSGIAFERAGRYTEIKSQSINKKLDPHIITFDGGYSNNSYAMMLCKLSKTENSKKIVASLLVEIAPIKGTCVLNYNQIYEHLIKPLIKPFNVCAIVADRWNSLKLLDDAREEFGVYTQQYTCKHSDFILFKSYATSNGFEIPKCEIDKNDVFETTKLTDYPHNFKYKPVAHFLYQCATVQENGKLITKGKGSTDDLFRCAVLSTAFLLDEKFYGEHMRTKVADNPNFGNGLIATPNSSFAILNNYDSNDKTVSVMNSIGVGGTSGNGYRRF